MSVAAAPRRFWVRASWCGSLEQAAFCAETLPSLCRAVFLAWCCVRPTALAPLAAPPPLYTLPRSAVARSACCSLFCLYCSRLTCASAFCHLSMHPPSLTAPALICHSLPPSSTCLLALPLRADTPPADRLPARLPSFFPPLVLLAALYRSNCLFHPLLAAASTPTMRSVTFVK